MGKWEAGAGKIRLGAVWGCKGECTSLILHLNSNMHTKLKKAIVTPNLLTCKEKGS